jgi:uncharacterized hydrophobic protein (TIGR00341 family)
MTYRDSQELRPKDVELVIGAWGVRNYHTTLEQRAISGATITGGYISMVVAATVMATAGLLLNSAAVVIGSMCVAPFMAPSRAVCIGALFRNGRVFLGGIIKQLFGLLVIGACVSAAITFVLQSFLSGIDITPEILLRAMPSARDVILSTLIAVSAGAAASLALIAQPNIVEHPWGQAIDAVIGVQVAISLIPPAAVIGIAWALGQPQHSWNAFSLLLLNVAALDLVGSVSILAISGVRRRHLELEKSIRGIVAGLLKAVPNFIALGSCVDVTLLGEYEAVVDVRLRCRLGGEIPDILADQIGTEIMASTSCHVDVAVEIISMLSYSSISD